MKHDRHHKARFVISRHLRNPPEYSVYSCVISLHSLWLLIFLAKLKDFQMWFTNNGTAYLKARTLQKSYINAGSEFGERKEQALNIQKALYVLCLYSLI